MYFKDRRDAGEKLALAMSGLPGGDVVVYGLARGGLVVASVVADKLKAQLDVLLVKKIGHPDSDEYAVGALAESSEPVWNELEVQGLDNSWLEEAKLKATELNRTRALDYRQNRDLITPADKIAIIVDDGIATGLSMRAAADYIKKQKPKYLVVAVPVASPDALKELDGLADKTVVLEKMDWLVGAVGAYYEDFPQVTDSEVKSILGDTK